MTKHAVGVLNGNFRNGDYFRYAQSVSKAKADLCPKCGGKMSLPNYLVGKSDVCYSCYEAPHPVELATLAEADPAALAAAELEADMVTFGGEGQHITPNLQKLIDAGCLDANGNLKPYVASGHKSPPMTLEELGDDGQQYPY